MFVINAILQWIFVVFRYRSPAIVNHFYGFCWSAMTCIPSPSFCWKFSNAFVSKYFVSYQMVGLILSASDWSFNSLSSINEFKKDNYWCSCCMHWSLSLGSLISILAVFISTPRNVKVVDGPSNFSIARGMTSSSLVFVRISRLLWQVVDVRGPILKKSSR